MKVHVLSDLHLEAAPFSSPRVAADIVVLAGDIANGSTGVEWAQRSFDAPVLYVPGNHEFYDHELDEARVNIRSTASTAEVTVLDCATYVIGSVRFIGCTLWTDFELPGALSRRQMLELARAWITDFRVIRNRGRMFTPEDSMGRHALEKAWLARTLAEPFEGRTVVITHHAPHPGSVAAGYANHPANPGFVSDLTPLMGRASIWIHGHTHTAFDYAVGETRVVCNPRGYPGEKTGFDAELVITV